MWAEMQSETYVHIDNLRLRAYHGVLPQERQVGNDYRLDIKVACPWQNAMETDNVADTIDYSALASVVKRVMSQPSNLVEHVAGRIANEIKATFPSVTSVWIRITKITPPMSVDCDGAGVELHVTF